MTIDWLSFALGAGAGAALVLSFVMLIVFDMFGAPHPRKKLWFQFWRSK